MVILVTHYVFWKGTEVAIEGGGEGPEIGLCYASRDMLNFNCWNKKTFNC